MPEAQHRDLIMKSDDLDSIRKSISKEQIIEITDSSKEIVGLLVPFSSHSLSDDSIINSMTAWRLANKKMFPTQVTPNAGSTIQFLSRIIEDGNSTLFGIYDNSKTFVGHIGLIQRTEDTIELAHLIRGINSGDPKLIINAEASLLNWCFQHLEVESIIVELMSYNWIVMLLHNELGFSLIRTSSLKKIIENDGIYHEVVSQEDSNVKYGIAHLELTKKDFYIKAPWFMSEMNKHLL